LQGQLDLLDGLAADPARWTDQRVHWEAIKRAAVAGGGYVSAGTIRDELSRHIEPAVAGAMTTALVRRGWLADTARTAESRNWGQRNGRRLVRVYRLTRTDDPAGLLKEPTP
jgi:ribosomal protein S9